MAVLLGGVASAAPQPAPLAATAAEIAALPPPLADYHMHLQTPAVTQELEKMRAKDPNVFALMDAEFLQPRDGAAALRVLDRSGVRYGVLLSEAYMFASPRMKVDGDIAALTRAENAFNVAQAKASHGRLLAFIGVNPLSPTAKTELTYWTRARGASGLKLHLANSQLNLDSASDRAALGATFALASREALPIVIHLRNDKTFPAARIVGEFVGDVLPKAGGSPVQIAHGGGWGGLDEETVQSLTAFADAIEAKKPGTRNLTFDLTLVVYDLPHTDPLLAQRFVAQMRRIGMGRFVFGSDWPTKGAPGDCARVMEQGLPLSAAEWRVILTHRARWLPT